MGLKCQTLFSRKDNQKDRMFFSIILNGPGYSFNIFVDEIKMLDLKENITRDKKKK